MEPIEKDIRAYLARSAGNCNEPSDFTIRCFVGMIETGEATIETFHKVGGNWLVDRIRNYAKAIGSVV